MEYLGLHPIRECIRRRKANIAEEVAFCPIYELCFKAERMPGTSWMVIWWDQDVTNKPEE